MSVGSCVYDVIRISSAPVLHSGMSSVSLILCHMTSRKVDMLRSIGLRNSYLQVFQ